MKLIVTVERDLPLAVGEEKLMYKGLRELRRYLSILKCFWKGGSSIPISLSSRRG